MSMLDRLLRRGDAAGESRLEDVVLREVRAGGRAFEHVVFTRNARVMVSVGDDGRALRLNERFREAPAEVLRAVGAMYAAEGRRSAEGKAVVRTFLRETAPPSAPGVEARRRKPRPRRVATSDIPHVERLRREFDRVNAEHFGGELPRVHIALSRRMRRRNGHFSADPLEIVISRRLCVHAADGEAEMTLRHEMIHLWQHVEGRKPGHGVDFRGCANRIGVHPRATRAVCWG